MFEANGLALYLGVIYNSDFNYDFNVSFTPEQIATRKRVLQLHFGLIRTRRPLWQKRFLKDEAGQVFHTASSFRPRR